MFFEKAAKGDMIVLHPLPRVDEIAVEVDNDPRALYFKRRYEVIQQNGYCAGFVVIGRSRNKSL